MLTMQRFHPNEQAMVHYEMQTTWDVKTMMWDDSRIAIAKKQMRPWSSDDSV